MKKVTIILVGLITASLLTTSCQEAKEPEAKQEVQAQKEEVKQPLEAKPEFQPKEQQPLTPPEVKEEKKEESKEVKTSPLTEKEQREFEKFGGDFATPNAFQSEKQAIKYLKILIKGDHRTIRWYQSYEHYPTDKDKKKLYGEDICTVIHALHALTQKPKETIDIVIEVIQKKTDYPIAYACACKFVGSYATKQGRDEKIVGAIPLLKEAIKHPDPEVRLEAAGALLASGEADIALPVLDELSKQGEVESLAKLFEPDKEGVVRWSKLKFWDERGLDIIKRALDYPSDEVKGWAAIALASLHVEKEKTEDVALNIVKTLMYKTEKDYGFEVIGGPSNPKWVLLPESKGKNLDELREKFSSDIRACNYVISALGRLKSKRAVPLLKHIKENNTEGDKACWEDSVHKSAEHALERILGDGGVK